jgi:hypothetical protein
VRLSQGCELGSDWHDHAIITSDRRDQSAQSTCTLDQSIVVITQFRRVIGQRRLPRNRIDKRTARSTVSGPIARELLVELIQGAGD